MIKLNNIVATYTTVRGQVSAVDGINLTIPSGKIIGIAGESGCGKSTLIKVIYGNLSYPLALTTGDVEYDFTDKDGKPVTNKNIKDYWFKRISYIPQSSMNSLNPVVRIRKKFLDFLDGERRHPGVLDEIREYVKSLDLPSESIDAYPHQLSGGMRQRIMIAIATGSGFIMDKEGHVVTNNHVVEGAEEITVRMYTGKEYSAKLAGRDPDTDLAVIKFTPEGDVPVEAVDNAADARSLYEIPLVLHEEGLDRVVCDLLRFDEGDADLTEWVNLVNRIDAIDRSVRVGIVGKYVSLPDAYLSVVEALKHGGFQHGTDIELDWIQAEDVEGLLADGRLRELDGIVIPGDDIRVIDIALVAECRNRGIGRDLLACLLSEAGTAGHVVTACRARERRAAPLPAGRVPRDPGQGRLFGDGVAHR